MKAIRSKHQHDERREERRRLVFYAGYAEKSDIVCGWPGVGPSRVGYAARRLGVRIPRSLRFLLREL